MEMPVSLMHMMYISTLFIWLLLPLGSCDTNINPTYTTTCLNSSTNFTCSTNQHIEIEWLINGESSLSQIGYNPSTTFSNAGQVGSQSSLIIPGSYKYDGALVMCYYSSSNHNNSAFLRVQGPPLNLTATPISTDAVKLFWLSSTDGQNPLLLNFIVLIKDVNGTVRHNVTVRNSHLIIRTPDPCGQYEATVIPLCQGMPTITRIQIPGVPPPIVPSDSIVTTLTYPDLPEDNVTLNISIPQPGVCNYTILVKPNFGETFLPSVLHSYENVSYTHIFSLSLKPNLHFTLIIIASNSHGSVGFNTSVSTHSVVAVNVSTTSGTEITCVYNLGSTAIGCLINLTYMANGITYCIVLQRHSNISKNNGLGYQSCNATFGAGKYLLMAYDIEKDGNASKLPAVIEEVLLDPCASMVPEKSFSPTTHYPASNDSQKDLRIEISASISALLAILLNAAAFCICALCCKKKVRDARRKREATKISQLRLSDTSKNPFSSISNGEQIHLDCCVAYNNGSSEPIKLSQTDFERYKIEFTDILISSYQLKLEHKPIGEGAFGVVYGAMFQRGWGHEAVAVKTVKELYSRSDLEQFFDECYRMKTFKHPNVVELIGICLDSPDGFPLMILPLYPNGNLKTYLQKRRKYTPFVTTLPEGLSTNILIAMCLDIAQGMEYLTGKGFVHRDLAARNCMVDLNLCVKVGDFGFTREASYLVSYIQKCPVKWMPPEMLQDGISTEKSDVWAYGVTCWEVFSLGATPYPGVANHEMLELLFHGLRLKIPTLCPENMFMLMKCCWSSDSARRPSFLELVTQLQEIAAKFT